MATSVATSGFGTLFKMGDGGVGAGAQASKTIGISNQQLKVLAKSAGTAGNSKTFGIVVSGNSTAYSQVITPTSVLINSATDSGGLATTTVAKAIEQLYLNSDFASNFQATFGTGNGTGVLVAGASGVLSGGTAGTEVFTTLSEIKDISGLERMAGNVEVTHMESPNGAREYISTLYDSGKVNFDMNFTNVASQKAFITAVEARARGNYQLVFVTTAGTVTYQFAGLAESFNQSFGREAALAASGVVKITSNITEV